jgi:hypothetical protein
MSEQSIYREVREFIAAQIQDGKVILVGELALQILISKPSIEGQDKEFYQIAAMAYVKTVVKRCVGKFDAAPVSDPQLVLDGFEHLQVAYSVERDGQICLVPVDQLTPREIEARAAEYEQMAASCRKHAKELREYARNSLSVAA